MHGTISSKGEVTVPAEVRERFGLVPGTAVSFEIREEGVLLRKDGPTIHPVDKVWATLPFERPVDEILDEMRGPRPRLKDLLLEEVARAEIPVPPRRDDWRRRPPVAME